MNSLRPGDAIWCHWTGSALQVLQWHHNDHDGVSNHQPHGCLLNHLFRRISKKTSKLCVTGLCVGNSPGPVNFPHKGPVTRKRFPFDDVIMLWLVACWEPSNCLKQCSLIANWPLSNTLQWESSLGDSSFWRKMGHYFKKNFIYTVCKCDEEYANLKWRV